MYSKLATWFLLVVLVVHRSEQLPKKENIYSFESLNLETEEDTLMKTRKKVNIPIREEKEENLSFGRIPYKADKCEIFTYNQTIYKRGCLPSIITNNLCYGQCGSFYVPKKDPFVMNVSPLFQDCRHCVPDKYDMIHIPMYCPLRKRKHRLKKVMIIRSCRCKRKACNLPKK